MAEQARKAAVANYDQDDLVAFGRELLAEHEALMSADDQDEPLTLRLDDLLQDTNGEVVLFNDSGLPLVELEASTGVTEEGQSGPHVTAGGDDVSGFRYISFENGLTLYYQDGLDLIVRSEPS
jgi:hypothetical protein